MELIKRLWDINIQKLEILVDYWYVWIIMIFIFAILMLVSNGVINLSKIKRKFENRNRRE